VFSFVDYHCRSRWHCKDKRTRLWKCPLIIFKACKLKTTAFIKTGKTNLLK